MQQMIIILGSLALGVYWDAAKYKIGRIPDCAEPYNYSAIRWALLSLLGVPLVIYMMKRKILLARAAEHPVEAVHARRNKIFLVCGMGFFVFLFSLMDTGNISMVRNGVLELNKSLTVGEAIDNYKYFTSTYWESGTSDNGIAFVNANGVVDMDTLPVAADWKKDGLTEVELCFQFIINRDGTTFELGAFSMKVTNKDGQTEDRDGAQMGLSQLEVLGALKEIYANEPVS